MDKVEMTLIVQRLITFFLHKQFKECYYMLERKTLIKEMECLWLFLDAGLPPA